MSGDRRILYRLIPRTEWHPLTNGGAPPDYIPPAWDGPHVGKRLVEALRTLWLLPTSNGPRVFGNAWPAYFHGWEDQLAQQEMEKDVREQIERARNRTRLLPSAAEIACMEIVIGWPGRYLLDCPQLIRVVQVATFGRARFRDMDWAAQRLELPGRLVRRRHREGLDLIAVGLRREGARISARTLGVDIVDMLEVRKPEDIAPAFATLTGKAQVFYVCGDSLTNTFHVRINTLALGARLLTIHNNRDALDGGGFISYGVNISDLHRRAGDYVDKILRGAKPADLPVEQPTKFEMVINVTVAKALGLKVPEAFLVRADEVIE